MWEFLSSPIKAFLEPLAKALGETLARNHGIAAVVTIVVVAGGTGYWGREHIVDGIEALQSSALPLSQTDRQSLAELGNEIAGRLRNAYHLRGQPKYEAWTLAQIVVALQDHSGNH